MIGDKRNGMFLSKCEGYIMKGDSRIISILNKILSNELIAINQYFLHARILKNWGYNKLASKLYEESVDEMKHAQQLIDRILFLEGLPALQQKISMRIGKTVLQQLQYDLDLEIKNIPVLKEAIDICWNLKDHGTREILEHILLNEEEHIDWLEAQILCIKDMGIENYLAQQIHA